MINESEIRLLSERKMPVKSLGGYKKHLKLSNKEIISDKFLSELAASDLNDELDSAFAKLRSGFGFKRKELTATDPLENCGEVATPGFTFEVSVSTIEGEPSNVLWRRAISRISDAETVTSPEFEKTFGAQFNILELALNEPVDVEAVIDEVEDLDDPSVTVDYEKDASWCRIEYRGRKESIHVDSDRIRVQSASDIAPSELIETFLAAHEQFFQVAK
jgi:hypothetical protein